eukprot:2628537-Heterocapsa_arctica.AAC.1
MQIARAGKATSGAPGDPQLAVVGTGSPAHGAGARPRRTITASYVVAGGAAPSACRPEATRAA